MTQLNFKSHLIKALLLIGFLSAFAGDANAQSKKKKAAPKHVVAQKHTDSKHDAAKSTEAVASTPAPVSSGLSAVAITDVFFKKYKDEGTEQAIDYLFSTNKLFTDTAQIGGLKRKLIALKQSVGQYLGRELIAQKNAGKNLYFYAYVLRFESQPIRFTFMFYKPKNDWVLYHFKYDADLDAELEQAGKIK
jgi:hypothetical protein